MISNDSVSHCYRGCVNFKCFVGNCACGCYGCKPSKADPSNARLPLTLAEEVVALREQVTRLQTESTEQLTCARRCAFETAAKLVVEHAKRYDARAGREGDAGDFESQACYVEKSELLRLMAELILEKIGK